LGGCFGSPLLSFSLLCLDPCIGLDITFSALVVSRATSCALFPYTTLFRSGIGGDLSLSIVPTAPPTATITSPSNGAVFYVGDAGLLEHTSSLSEHFVIIVHLYLDFTTVGALTNRPYQLSVTFTNGPFGHRL